MSRRRPGYRHRGLNSNGQQATRTFVCAQYLICRSAVKMSASRPSSNGAWFSSISHRTIKPYSSSSAP